MTDSGKPGWKQTFTSAFIAQVLSIVGFSFAMPFLPFFIRDLGIRDPAQQAWWAGIILGATYIVMAERELLDLPWLTVPKGVLAVVFWVPAFAFLLLQLSNVPYVKPSKERLGAAMGITILAMAVTGHAQATFYICMALTLVTYVVAGLVSHRAHAAIPADEDEEEEEDVPVIR